MRSDRPSLLGGGFLKEKGHGLPDIPDSTLRSASADTLLFPGSSRLTLNESLDLSHYLVMKESCLHRNSAVCQ